MQNLAQLDAKLERAQVEIDKGVGNLTKHRAFLVDRIAGGEDVTKSQELLQTLEDTQLLHVRQRDRLRREMDARKEKRTAFQDRALLERLKLRRP
jgi:predicted AAA+ superfamily ATPase